MDKHSLPHNHGESENIIEKIPRTEDFEVIATVLKQLCDASRIRIFWILCHSEECVINLSALVGMSSPAVSHHLRQLKSAGLITSSRKGKEVYYKAAENHQAQFLHVMIVNLMELSCPTK